MKLSSALVKQTLSQFQDAEAIPDSNTTRAAAWPLPGGRAMAAMANC